MENKKQRKKEKIDVSYFWMGLCSLTLFISVFIPTVLSIANQETYKEMLRFMLRNNISFIIFGSLSLLFLYLTVIFFNNYFEFQDGSFKNLFKRRHGIPPKPKVLGILPNFI